MRMSRTRARGWPAALVTALAMNLASCGAGPAHAPQKPAAKKPAPVVARAEAEPWRKTRPGPGPRGKIDYPAAEVVTLDNGIKVFFVARRGSLVSTSVVAIGGAAELPAGKSGLAALTARMMTEGTKHKSSLALAEAVEDLGGSLEQQASRDHVRIGLTSRAVDFDEAVALLAEVVKQPAFDKAELERVRAQWLDDLDAERQHPSRLAQLAGVRLALGLRAGAPVSGTPAEVAKLTRADLSKFHQGTFVPARMAIVVAGDVSKDAVLRAARGAFGDLRGSVRPVEVAPPAPAGEPGIYVVDRPQSVQTAIFAAHVLPKRSEPGYEAREVMNDALGGLFTSRLNRNLREKHAFTYGARSSVVGARHFGLFAITTSVRSDVTADAVREIMSELRALGAGPGARPLDEDETARAKADLIQSAGSSLEHLERVRHDLEELFVQSLPADYYATFASRIEAIPLDDVRAQARLVEPDRLVIVLVGDRSLLDPALARLGAPIRTMTPALVE